MGGFAYFPGTAPAPWTGDLYGFSYIGGSGGGGGGSFAGWTRKAPLVIQHLQVTANQTAFPVLITAACLPAEMVTLGGANAAQADGGDIRFSSDAAGANQLACQIVIWTQNAVPASATAEIWVPVNVLTASDVTIYVWYHAGGGLTQPAANTAFGSQAVWDANYKGVWHWANGTTLSVADSTGVSTPANHAAVAIAGQIDGAMSTAGGVGYVDAGGSTLTGTSTSFTMESWIYHISGSVGVIACNYNPGSTGGGFDLYVNSGATSENIVFEWLGTGGVSQQVISVDNVIAVNTWKHVVATLTGTTSHIYVNGVEVTYVQHPSSSGVLTNPLPFLWANVESLSNIFKGNLDESRMSITARSATWVSTSFNNQSAPATFTIAGTPLSAP